MRDHNEAKSVPEFVYICGSVGSGNTFMFGCLTQDENVYGINEDAFGSTLERLAGSEKDMGKCPHSISEFIKFAHALRKDRRTLVLKTPSNIRRMQLLKQHMSNSHFILMVREPHSAIVSGLRRHGTSNVEGVARTWLSDTRYYTELDSNSLIVIFEDLARDPAAVLQRVSDRILPLSKASFDYGRRMHRPERAEAEWWHAKVDEHVRQDIEHWVKELDLMETYRLAREGGDSPGGASRNADSSVPSSPLAKALVKVKKEFFGAWYRLRR